MMKKELEPKFQRTPASKIYTYKGDSGTTRTLQGEALPKNNCLIEINGDIDSLQAIIDKLVVYSAYSEIMKSQKTLLVRIQSLLWQLGGEISQQKIGGLITDPIKNKDIADLELAIDSFELNINKFQRFTNLIAVDVNEARVRTRKLERTLTYFLQEKKIRPVIYQYINRLSDYFFALSVKIQRDEKPL